MIYIIHHIISYPIPGPILYFGHLDIIGQLVVAWLVMDVYEIFSS